MAWLKIHSKSVALSLCKRINLRFSHVNLEEAVHKCIIVPDMYNMYVNQDVSLFLLCYSFGGLMTKTSYKSTLVSSEHLADGFPVVHQVQFESRIYFHVVNNVLTCYTFIMCHPLCRVPCHFIEYAVILENTWYPLCATSPVQASVRP